MQPIADGPTTADDGVLPAALTQSDDIVTVEA